MATTTEGIVYYWYDHLSRDYIPTVINSIEKALENHDYNSFLFYYNDKAGAFDKNNNLIKEFDSLQLAAQFCGGNSSTISAVCRGKRNTHKNYIWRYLD